MVPSDSTAGAVIGEAVAALGSRGERTAEQVLAEYLRGLHRGKRVAGDIGGDIAILDALDAVLDRNDRRGSAVLGGGGNRLGDNGLGDERAGAVVYGNEHGVFRCGRDACENGFRAGLAARALPCTACQWRRPSPARYRA